VIRTTEHSQALACRLRGNAHLLRLADILDNVPEECYLQHAWTDCAGAYCAASWWAVHHPERWIFLPQGPVLRDEGCPWFSIAKEFDMNAREVSDVFGIYGGAPSPKEAAAFIREFVDIRGEVPRWMLFPDAWPAAKPCNGVMSECTHCHG
jgi:hypothetical protein